MPPPSAADPWLAGRHFGIVIDAGSSGSRLQIYSWRDPRSITLERGSELAYTLPKVEKGTQRGDEWVHKVEPGISSFANTPKDVGSYLRPLLNHAREHIPPSLEHETPIFLLATAGMRLLQPIQQAEILQETCHFLSRHSNFKIDKASDIGPCGSSVRIITGEEEGLFGWIAVNYLMDGFTGAHQDRTTYGFLDMGGASTQIAFEPGAVSQKEEKDVMNVRLRQLGGQEINHKVFVTTWLGYGTNQARQRYVGKTISDFEDSRPSGDMHDVVSDPCLPKDLQLHELPVHDEATDPHTQREHTLKGTGSFEKCLAQTAPLLNKNAPCSQTPCPMDGIHVPPIDFSVSHFIGVSEYWYSSEHVFGLGGAYDFVQYERAASKFCSRPWDDILKQHEESRKQHQLGGDGEVEKNGTIVDVGQWDAKVERSRLEMQCFKAAWITNVLHEGLGLPRITDPGGNETSTEGARVEEEAAKKGLGRPTFQSLDTVGDISISWTLGKMVLEASKEVPAKGTSKPLVDPIEEVPDSPNFHVKPIRPPFWSLKGMEDRLNPHLPAAFTRSSLGFSPVLFLLAVMICVLVFILYPLRRNLRATCLRTMRQASMKRERDESFLEEGTLYGRRPGSAPGTPTSATKSWFYPLRRVISASVARRPPSPISTHGTNGRFNIGGSPLRASPTRSNSLPPINTQDINEPIGNSTQFAYTISRSPSPAPSFVMDDSTMKAVNGLSSRSRNGSTNNLSRMVISRTPSYQKAPKGLADD